MIPRIYHPHSLNVNEIATLRDKAQHHLVHVLRLKENDPIILFDGAGNAFDAILTSLSKREAKAKVSAQYPTEPAVKLPIHLGQGIARGEKMDWIIQKATELGVSEITPLITSRVQLKLTPDHLEKKHEHWQEVIIHACQQSGRARMPQLNPAQLLPLWVQTPTSDHEIKLVCRADGKSISEFKTAAKSVRLLIGPESGLAEEEIERAHQHHFESLSLGPRILRTETATLAALTATQLKWGDF